MKINISSMLKTLLFTLQNGKNISSAMKLLSKSSKSKKERDMYITINNDLQDGMTFSKSLEKQNVGSLDVIQFITMAEQSLSFKTALEKIINYIDIKDTFQRESNDKTSLPVIYFFISALIVIGVRFFAVPYQIAKSKEYSPEVQDLIAAHLQVAQFLADTLFVFLVLIASYFILLLLSLFSQDRAVQGIAKELALFIPFTSKIVLKFEKFILFSILGEMLQSGISYKNAITTAFEITVITKFKKALSETLQGAKNEGKMLFHPSLYDSLEQELLIGIGSSSQMGKVFLEISNRARIDALELTGKFLRMITFLSILLMAFAVFVEFFTVVLTQVLIQKGLIDMTRGVGSF